MAIANQSGAAIRLGSISFIVIALLAAVVEGEGVNQHDWQCNGEGTAPRSGSGGRSPSVYASMRIANDRETAILAQSPRTFGWHHNQRAGASASGKTTCDMDGKTKRGEIAFYCSASGDVELDLQVLTLGGGLSATVKLLSAYDASSTNDNPKLMDVSLSLDLGIKAELAGQVVSKSVNVHNFPLVKNGSLDVPGCWELGFFKVCSGLKDVSFRESSKVVHICGSYFFELRFPQSKLALDVLCYGIDVKKAFE